MKIKRKTEPVSDNRLRVLIGKRIRELRVSKQLKISELASKSQYAASSLTNIEEGKRSTSIVMLNSICKGLGITLNEFFANERFNSKI